MNNNVISQIVDDCLKKIRQLSNQPDTGLRNELRSLLVANLSKLNLVSRDDFEAQKLLLQRTSDKLAKLEAIIANLEQQK